MRKRKLEESFRVQEALRMSVIEIEADGRSRCPFHKNKDKHLKYYRRTERYGLFESKMRTLPQGVYFG